MCHDFVLGRVPCRNRSFARRGEKRLRFHRHSQSPLFLRKYTMWLFSGHKAQNLGGEGGENSIFLCSPSESISSSTTILFPFIPYNKFLHPPTTPQSPKCLIRSMKTLPSPQTQWNKLNLYALYTRVNVLTTPPVKNRRICAYVF